MASFFEERKKDIMGKPDLQGNAQIIQDTEI
jgi:hypothetical protein